MALFDAVYGKLVVICLSALMLRLSSLLCLIWSHKLLVDRDG